MSRRGRPCKNGAQPGWMLGRALRVLYEYNEARKRGGKHSCAIVETVGAVQSNSPQFPISETEVKRVLAQFQPKGARSVFIVSKGPDAELPPGVCKLIDDLGLPPGTKKMKRTFSVGSGPRPKYRRHNSR